MVRLVIVDDHRLVREAWKRVLSRDERIDVIAECKDGDEAVVAARELEPDLMMMDITMEPLNGVDATLQIRKFNTGIRIIGVSVHSDLAHVHAIMNAGANGYVTKNSSADEMIHAILEVMEGRVYIGREIIGYQPGA